MVSVMTCRVRCPTPSKACSAVTTVATMANPTSRPSLPHHARRQGLVRDDVDTSHERPTRTHATRTRGPRWSRAYRAAPERASARSPSFSPSDPPRGADPGAPSHAPSEPPRQRIIRTRQGRAATDGWDRTAVARRSGRPRVRAGEGGAGHGSGGGGGGGDGRGRGCRPGALTPTPLPPRAASSDESEPGSGGGASAGSGWVCDGASGARLSWWVGCGGGGGGGGGVGYIIFSRGLVPAA